MDTTGYKVGQKVRVAEQIGSFLVGTPAVVTKIEHGMVWIRIDDNVVRIEYPSMIEAE